MKTIYKYVIPYAEPQFGEATFFIETQEILEILKVDKQHNVTYVWAVVDPATELRETTIQRFGTGIPMNSNLREYIGTVIEEHFVWHYFIQY